MPTPKPRPAPNRSTSSAARSGASRSTPSRSGTARTPSGGSSRISTTRTTRRTTTSAARVANLDSNDPGVQRRAVKKKQEKRKNFVVWVAFCGLSAVITGMTLGVYHGKGRYLDSKARLASKQATLRDLGVRLESAKRRVAAMSSAAGKHRTLVENGFLSDGERLLLFPMNPEKNGVPDRH